MRRWVTAEEIEAWRAFHAIEPIGPAADRRLMAEHVAITAEVNRDRKKRIQPYVPEDFMPWVERPEMSPEDKMLAQKAMFIAMAAEHKRRAKVKAARARKAGEAEARSQRRGKR